MVDGGGCDVERLRLEAGMQFSSRWASGVGWVTGSWNEAMIGKHEPGNGSMDLLSVISCCSKCIAMHGVAAQSFIFILNEDKNIKKIHCLLDLSH